MSAFTAEEYAARVRALQQALRTREIPLAILTVNADVTYFTGSPLPWYLLVPAEGEALALVRRGLARLAELSPWLAREAFTEARELPSLLARRGWTAPARVGYTLDATPYATVARWQRLFPEAETMDIAWDVRAARMVKSPAEVAVQRRAGAVASRMPRVLREAFRPGMGALELSAALDADFRRQGHAAVVRCRREGGEGPFGVCTAGESSLAVSKFDGVSLGSGLSPAVPTGAGPGPLARGETLLIDYGVCLDGYLVDQSRMASWGPPPPEAARAYDAMRAIAKQLIAGLRPGRPWEDVYRDAVALADRAGYAGVFMGAGPDQVRFVGHGLGLELDEPPFLAPGMSQPLAEGMVVAVEPKVALPGVGVVGLEDTVAISEDGAEYLTTAEREWIVLA